MTTPTVLFAGKPADRETYARELARASEEAALPIRVVTDPDEVPRAEVDYLVFNAKGPMKEFEGFTRLKAMHSLWAGVDEILKLSLPQNVPLLRMVEDGLTLGMLDYVTGHVLRHHLGIDQHLGHGADMPWSAVFPPLARERQVTVLGIGELGAACAERLALNGFKVRGWARSQKQVPGVECHAGPEGLAAALDGAEILVLLLPDTPGTRHVVDAAAIARLAPGAAIVNPGRGPLIDDDALLAALDAGHLGHATLDVFDVEPLPADHPFWAHPKVTVTPHIASATRPGTAAEAILRQIARGERGEPFLHVVQRTLGY
ncbi:MAG: glyoxylate/hydroxypyruvate reductase A [Pseudomonadota bacterium]